MPKRRILILDCTPKDEPSEGRLVKSFFEICKLYKPAKASSVFYKIRSKNEFLRKLDTGKPYDVIHISAHGEQRKEGEIGIGNGRTWWATPEEIETTNHKADLVFVNACLADRRAIAEAFNYKYFLAPMREVPWIKASLFALMFYNRYIVDGKPIDNALEYARRRTQTCRYYLRYWKG